MIRCALNTVYCDDIGELVRCIYFYVHEPMYLLYFSPQLSFQSHIQTLRKQHFTATQSQLIP